MGVSRDTMDRCPAAAGFRSDKGEDVTDVFRGGFIRGDGWNRDEADIEVQRQDCRPSQGPFSVSCILRRNLLVFENLGM